MTAKYPVLQALLDIEVKHVRNALPDAEPELRNAAARWVTTIRPASDGGRVVLLQVDCPYCEHTHVHSGGTTRNAQLGTRDARCYGRATGGLRYVLRIDHSVEGGAA